MPKPDRVVAALEIAENILRTIYVLPTAFVMAQLFIGKSFGWNGILAEPARCWHAELAANRNCIAVEWELVRTSTPTKFVHGWDRVAGEYEEVYRKIIPA